MSQLAPRQRLAEFQGLPVPSHGSLFALMNFADSLPPSLLASSIRCALARVRLGPARSSFPSEGAPLAAKLRRTTTPMTLAASLLALALSLALPAQAQQETATVRGTVTDAGSEQSLPGASISVAGTESGTSTGGDGTYALDVAPGAVTLEASFVGFETVEATITVEAGETVTRNFALSASAFQMDEAVVVGSRTRQRSVLESAVPVDVVNSEELESAGTVETAQMLQKLEPSVTFPREAMGDGTETVRPIRFRGMGPDQVLVLVNGKRRHQAAIEAGGSTAGVDLNAIPAQAIERIEVLRDGASAQYGSDAVAGVINVILKEKAGTTAAFTGGLYGEGDGATGELSLNQGFGGFGLDDRGFFNVTGQFRYRDHVNRTGPDQRKQKWGLITEEADNGVDKGVEDVLSSDGVDTTFFDAEQQAYNQRWAENPEVTFRMGKPLKVDGGGFFNAELPVSALGEATIYSFGGLTSRFSESGCYSRIPQQSARYSELYPNGFTPMYSNYSTDASAALGIKGTASGYVWDVSGTYGGNFFERNMDDTHNATYGLQSPTYMKVGSKGSQQIAGNVDVSKPFDIGIRSFTVSVGTEVRAENYQIGAGQPEAYLDGGEDIPAGPEAGGQPAVGCQCFPGFTPGDEVNTWRSNVGAYLSASADLTDALFAEVAGRYEHYSDFGSAVIYKAAARYEFVDGYALRGAFNTGFRAPALLQTNFSSTQTGFEDIDGDGIQEGIDTRTFPLGSAGAQALGATPLEPETSQNLSGGLTAQPLADLSLTVDGYYITVQDRIRSTSTYLRSNPAVDALFSQFSELDNVFAGTFFTNAIDTRTYGLDAVARYGVDLEDKGQLRFTGAFNWNHNEVTGVQAASEELAELDESICDQECQMGYERALPRTNLSLTADYDVGAFGVTVRGWRPGEQVNAETFDFGNGEERVVLDHYNRVPATWLMDLEISYGFSNGLTLAVGGNNLFDQKPPRNEDVTYQGQTFNGSYQGNFPYVNQFDNAWGTTGGFYYARMKYDF